MPSLLLSIHKRLYLNDLSFISENQHVLKSVKRTEGKKNHAFHLWIHLKTNAGHTFHICLKDELSWGNMSILFFKVLLTCVECCWMFDICPFLPETNHWPLCSANKNLFFPFILASTVSVALENFYLRLFFLLCILALELLLFLWAINCMATKSTEIFWEEEALLILNSHILCQQLAFYFQRTRQYKNK